MRIILILVMGLHGSIHLFGFLKAYDITTFQGISEPISKPVGAFWLVSFILFAITIILLIWQPDYWWLGGFMAILVSQALIFYFWSDAKFGTLINILILLASIVSYSDFRFTNQILAERKDLFQRAQTMTNNPIIAQEIADLPPVVRKWLHSSTEIGQPIVSNVYLTQELKLKMNPGQKDWSSGTANQIFTVQPPGFNWVINTSIYSLISTKGRDKLVKGKGEMTIKLFSLFPVVHADNNYKVNQATLQRYLAEIVWFPSAALSPDIHWEALNDHSAKATMDIQGTKASGIFHFNEYGQFVKFVAMRYKDVKDPTPTQWSVEAIKFKDFKGIKVPVECEVSWMLNGEKWTWLKVKIVDISYNIAAIP